MPRVHHVKKARKAIKGTDIKKGDSYYWWQFAYSNKQCSKIYPRPSQLTRSEFWGGVHGVEEDIEDWKPKAEDIQSAEDLTEHVTENFIPAIEELIDNTQEKVDNIPENLQSSANAEMMEGRVDALEEYKSNLESVEPDSGLDEALERARDLEDDPNGVHGAAYDEALAEVQGMIDAFVEELQSFSVDCE